MSLKLYSKPLRPVGLLLGLLPVFTLLTYVGMTVYVRTGSFTTVRPMGGVALGLILVLGRRSIAPVLLAAVMGSASIKFMHGYGFADAFIATALTIGAASALYILHTGMFRLDFRNWRCLLRFMGLAVVMSAFGALIYALMNPSLSRIDHVQWALTTALSFCVFTPVTVLLGSMDRSALRARGWRLAAVMAGLAMVTAVPCFIALPVPTIFVAPLAMAVVVMLTEVEGAAAGLLLIETMLTATIAFRPGLAGFQHTPVLGWQLFTSQIVVVTMTMVILPLGAAVSEKQKLRNDLRAAAAKAEGAARMLEGIIDSVQDHAIYMLDTAGTIVTWNNGAKRSKGFSREDVIGTNYARFFPAEAVQAGMPQQDLTVAATQGRFHGEGWRLNKQGQLFWAEVFLTAIRDPDGNLLGFAKVCRDITEHRKHLETLAIAKEAAERASEAKSEFLANISHEIRTPLTSVIGFSSLIHDQEDLSRAVRGYALQVRNAARRLMALINDVLDYSSLENGEINLDAAPTHIGAVLDEVAEILSVQAEAKGLSIETIPGSALDLTVMLDRDRLGQILMNLIGNAVKFTESGFVRVTAQYRPAEERLHFLVQDTGPGIAPGQINYLFQRFSRLKGDTDKRPPGTGLGLAISKKLAEAMGGSIGVNSWPGTGSTFWFEVSAPLAPAASGGMARMRAQG